MRILFPIHGIGAGVGSEDYMVSVARGLATRGHTVILLAPRGSDVPDWDPALVAYSQRTPDPWPVLWRLWHPMAVIHQIASAAMATPPPADLVMTGLLPALFGRWLRSRQTPRVYLPQSPLAWFELLADDSAALGPRLAARLYDWLQHWAWTTSDGVNSYTPQLTATRTHWFKGSPRHLTMLPPGIDFDQFAPGPANPALRDEFGIAHSAPLVVTLGRLTSSKDVDFLLRAFVRRDVPQSAHLLIIGRGPERDVLLQSAAALGVAARVHFAGFRDDVADYLRAGDVFAFPSRLESFGLALAQAMACGLPAVARRHRFPDVLTFSESMIDDGRTGYLVDTEAEMAASLGRLLTDQPLRSGMGSAAAQLMRERFTWTAHLDAIERLMDAAQRR